ncbi:MAG TPA: nucleotide exchange factor GrpE [Bryobacteraceae bacterium]|nr:nucleotide exchange factor GrpE [Bryobacteraceae bacterium]
MDEVKNASGSAGVDTEEQAENVDRAADPVRISDPAEQLATLAAEKAELQDLLMRRQAEFDNFRKRIDREKMELLEYSSLEAVNAILPIVDDFDRAIKVESADREYARGMELIHQRLADSLKRLGLETVETSGQKFDPNLHHAVTKEKSDEHDEDTILEEYQKGYRFKGRILRPAMVKVSVRS